MSKKSSPTAVGAFVIGAIVLIVIGIMLFSSGKFFTRTYKLLAVFPGNVQGLNIGAAVVMRGVRVGSVTDIDVVLDKDTKEIIVPVYMEIERGTVLDVSLSELTMTDTERDWQQEVGYLVEGGLRAQLKLQSLVTGQMLIDFDFYPDAPANLTDINDDIVEVPTVATITDKLINELEQIPMKAIANKLLETLDGINSLVRSEDVKNSAHNANLALVQFRQTLNSVETSVNNTLGDISMLTRNVDSKVEPLADSAVDALNEAKSALKSIDNLLGKDSATRADLGVALDEFAKAARSLRILADYLQQHPESLIKGKGY
jgi:paraquat-inducible protein B